MPLPQMIMNSCTVCFSCPSVHNVMLCPSTFIELFLHGLVYLQMVTPVLKLTEHRPTLIFFAHRQQLQLRCETMDLFSQIFVPHDYVD